jgi:hypothetical protein
MGSSEPMVPIKEEVVLRWTQMKVYSPPAKAKKLIPTYVEARLSHVAEKGSVFRVHDMKMRFLGEGA